MKKLLLSLLAASCVLTSQAGEITDVFTAENMPGMRTSYNPETQNGVTTEVTSGSGVRYTFTNYFLSTTNNLLNFTNEGARMTAQLDMNCAKIVLNGASNQLSNGNIRFSVGDKEIATVTNGTAKTFEFEIPAEYQAAGTVYTFERVDGTNRISSITYNDGEACAVPEFSIPDGSYILAGQKISITNLDGDGTVKYAWSVPGGTGMESGESDGTDQVFTTPAFTRNLFDMTLTATMSAPGKAPSSAAITLHCSNGKRPVITDARYVSAASSPDGTVYFYYDVDVINLYGNTSAVTVYFRIYDSDGQLVATAEDNQINVKPSDAAATAALADEAEITPLQPTTLDCRTAVATGVPHGEYTFVISGKVGNNDEEELARPANHIVVTDQVITGVEDVAAADMQPAVYYTIDGRRVAEPRPGQVVIELRGTKARKVIF